MAHRLAPVVAAVILSLAIALGTGGAAAAPAPPGSLYVALGDSVAAGHGLGSPTGQADAGACRRSALAYPALLGRSPFFANPLGAAGSVACSGALTANLLDQRQTIADAAGPVTVDPQLAVVRRLAIAPATVTITAGANDAGWAETMDACLRQPGSGAEGPCARQLPRIARALHTVDTNLRRLVAEVAALPGDQRIHVTGYYDPFPGDLTNIGRALTCGPFGTSVRTAQLDGDFTLLQIYLSLLNRTIAGAATGAGAQYVDLTTVMDGHRLCSRAPWVVPPTLDSLTSGAAFHPTAEGQEAIAQALVVAAGGSVPHTVEAVEQPPDTLAEPAGPSLRR